MKILFQIAVFTLALTAYAGGQGNEGIPYPQKDTPIVKVDSSYEVLVIKDIVYAYGLSHQTINSRISEEMPIKLDAYIPNNEVKNRPAIVLIHGGGFAGGTKEHKHIVAMAKYFASRGWVAFSIDYRLKKHKGTVPDKWIEYAKNISEKEKATKYFSLYPAIRDAKAAVRWLYANAETYHINTNYITVGGGSAGAIAAIALGVSDPRDFTKEIPLTTDPSLASTHLNQPSKVHTILDFWGSKVAVFALEQTYNVERFDSSDAPILIVHGTKDPTVKFSDAKELKEIYTTTAVAHEFHPIPNRGHGAWKSTIKGKNLSKLSFDFILKQQSLITE